MRKSTIAPETQEYLEIGDVKLPINTPKNPELVPSGNLHYWGNDLDQAPSEVIGHLRWIAQKSLLGQDIFLTGPPTGNRRRLILTLAELCGWECEYLMITKDTTESDLKQRREIVGDSVVWCDAAPVRAAINGRILIIDGMENAERNVLPTINNLLENREMMLEDGRFLMKGDTIGKLKAEDSAPSDDLSARLVPVHPSFRVVALGLPVPPYHGRVLDPPLRSRFQSRFIDELSLDDALHCVDTSGFAASRGVDKVEPNESLKAVASVYEGLRVMRSEAIREGSGAAAVPSLSIDGLRHCLNILRPSSSNDGAQHNPTSVVNALSRSLPLGYAWRSKDTQTSGVALGSSLSQKHKTMLNGMMEKVRSLEAPSSDAVLNSTTGLAPGEKRLTAQQQTVYDEVRHDLTLGRNVCLLGGKGSGKSHLLGQIAEQLQQDMLVFPVFQEMSGRDMLQRRGTSTSTPSPVAATATATAVDVDSARNNSGSASASSSLWLDSPLVKAARVGKICVLDGVDRVDAQALLGIRSIVSSPTYYPPQPQQGFDGAVEVREIDLPSGERLLVHPDFRLICLGVPPTKSEDARMRYLNSDLNLSYHLLPDMTPSDIKRVVEQSTSTFCEAEGVSATVRDQLKRTDALILSAVSELYATAGRSSPELRPTLRHIQRVQSSVRAKLSNNSSRISDSGSLVHRLMSQALLVRFLSAASAAKFEQAMDDAGVQASPSGSAKKRNKFMKFLQNDAQKQDVERQISVDIANNTVTIGDVTCARRTCTLPELVPQPLFHENASHLAVLESLLLSYKASYKNTDNSVLLIGNQGVGKNKLVDRLLQVLNAEREYIQLHRDTTIQSLTLIPLLEHGQLTYEDSPLVRAAQSGRILVCDEVDKAPLEVICVLKGLIGDGELVLHDGRRLLSPLRAQQEYQHYTKIKASTNTARAGAVASFEAFCTANQIVPMHPDFRMFVLANRPGHPFQGNAFFRECGDLFSCHVIENLDIQSEVALLQAFAPNVPEPTVKKLANTFSELRALNDSGVLSYPFSAREAVAIVKHLQAFPQDPTEIAVEDILGFDGMNPQVRTVVAEVFQSNGFKITADAPRGASLNGTGAAAMRIKGGRREGDPLRQSIPRTGSNMPKHGKIDPDNTPHVGGNTWAGGSGGSDTAGLGGRGGPYRMQDPGNHPTHQISDADKAAVSKESKEAAAAMGKAAFEKRLEEIAMGKTDYQVYQQYRQNIALQVTQLREILNDISSRGKERVWLRNQSQGNLDDSKLVDGLSGERLVFKRRGFSDNTLTDSLTPNADDGAIPKKRVQFVVDVSGSMMRFNGHDRRLERMLEASLLVMEALPRRPVDEGTGAGVDAGDGAEGVDGGDGGSGEGVEMNAELAELMEYSITGHSGDTAREVFIDFPEESGGSSSVEDLFGMMGGGRSRFSSKKSKKHRVPRGVLNERDKMGVMEKMVAHSQFCMPGDHTLQATEIAVSRALAGAEDGDNIQRIVIVLSDANFDRYGISPVDLSRIMRQSDKVKVHMVLIASLGSEAEDVARQLPLGYAHLCSESSDLPAILRKILVSSFD
eukprot:CAMPEP_0170375242 /NCGR_PEP_ID=MMETSP0117_2-20130122/11058_1 /TAXON_ID=400756 /ORGANISM="Durinskia baltica, Strain CSIRO CS-38" /LENGTH=1559 /DNA_ID=CAMNT_0010630307 /DNA_START=124 /DNA_END=4803 /DNA_ORIENTATION=+